jgi:predicted nucleotidyltransferase
MAVPQITNYQQIIPTAEDFEKILKAKILYEAAQKTPTKDTWNKTNFNLTPWGIAYNCSKAKYDKSVASYNKAKRKSNNPPEPKHTQALKYFIIAIVVNWNELIDQLKRTLKNYEYTTESLRAIATNVWNAPGVAEDIAKVCGSVTVDPLSEQFSLESLTEAVEKHNTLNSKLFTKEEVLKDKVRDKMLEIVDEFLADLKEQDIKIKVDDVLFIGSNASYNYTKHSDIDLHILANAKAADYTPEVAAALYGAYRTIFNKNLDITLYDIPLEIFIETEDSTRVSNGVYSVKKNKWIKKPVAEDIPEYDTKALDELVNKWETDCKDLIDDVKSDKLEDEKKVVKLLENIYEKLRKKGIAKGEYSIENLAFKELRNKGYLDQLKEYKNELVSKRLSLEEALDKRARIDMYNQLARAAGTQPIIQDNGMFFIYNLKSSDIDKVLSTIRKLPFVVEASANESSKYDFSNTAALLRNNLPSKYYNIRGMISM